MRMLACKSKRNSCFVVVRFLPTWHILRLVYTYSHMSITYTYMCVYINIFIYVYIHAHTHTHTPLAATKLRPRLEGGSALGATRSKPILAERRACNFQVEGLIFVGSLKNQMVGAKVPAESSRDVGKVLAVQGPCAQARWVSKLRSHEFGDHPDIRTEFQFSERVSLSLRC